MKIVTVYRTGGDYTPEYVERIDDELRGEEHICLTDHKISAWGKIHPVPLKHDWPGWWSKMEIFKEEAPFLYLDLDTIINGPLEPIFDAVKDKRFVCIRPIFQDRPGAIASGMMYVGEDMSWVYEKFAEDPEGWIEETRFAATPSWNNGDQRCLELMGVKPDGYWQELCPGLVAHRKRHSLEERQKASVIWYSGQPRPADTGWAI